MASVDAPQAVARTALAIFAALAALFVFVVVTDTPVAAQDQTAPEVPQVFADPGASAGERYIIKYRDRGRARDAVRGRKGHVVLELPNHGVIAARLAEEGRQELEADSSVEYVEVDPRRYPMAAPWPNISNGAEISPYGIQMVQADQVSDAAAGNRMVCIIDTGYYRAHDDLQYSNVTASPDIGTGDPFVDRSSHGTHVAGTIAAIGNNGVGVRGVMQNQNLRIHIVKVFGDDGVFAYSSTVIHALTQCRTAGANVVSMSFGGTGQSTAERNAFAGAFAAGVLSVAAAGNDGHPAPPSFPASYPSVMSVGGVDSNEAHYTPSQRNSEVDIAAPAEAVLSTIGSVDEGRLVVAGHTYLGNPLEFSQSSGGRTGPLASGGFCGSPDVSWEGKVVLCQRGSGDGTSIGFLQKVQSVQDSGGVAAVIYNNAPGLFTGTLVGVNTTTIPAISLSQEDGLAALVFAGEDALVTSLVRPLMDGYALLSGTSLATAHVSAVAALVWSHNPLWTNVEIKDALEGTARDIGTAGRDDFFGHGIVQAKAALDFLCPNGCAPPGPAPAPATEDFVDTSEGDFDTGGGDVNARRMPGDLRLRSAADDHNIDQQDLTASNLGFGTNATNWFGQTFTAGESGQLVRVDLNLFCGGCGAVTAPPDFIVSIRATSGDLPTGPDLATATVPGFTSGAIRWRAFTFAAPVNITAGARYAIVGRPAANLPGSAIYVYIAAPAAPPDTYLAGRRVTSPNSGGTWVAPVAGRDINFRTYMTGPLPHTFASAGMFVSALMDANPAAGFAPQWNELSWSGTTPPGTSIKFQVAGSERAAGPFNFVGPDGTNATSFTASNFPLTQFDGYRHLRYAALLETSDPSQTPVLHDVTTTMGTVDAVAPVLTGVSVDKSVLWSPNHKFEDVVVSYQVTDNFDPAPVVRLSVTSNEPVDDPGSGNTSPDWEVASSTLVRLRAERSGRGTGRIYTITVTATDGAGNASSATVTVAVPKSQGQ